MVWAGHNSAGNWNEPSQPTAADESENTEVFADGKKKEKSKEPIPPGKQRYQDVEMAFRSPFPGDLNKLLNSKGYEDLKEALEKGDVESITGFFGGFGEGENIAALQARYMQQNKFDDFKKAIKELQPSDSSAYASAMRAELGKIYSKNKDVADLLAKNSGIPAEQIAMRLEDWNRKIIAKKGGTLGDDIGGFLRGVTNRKAVMQELGRINSKSKDPNVVNVSSYLQIGIDGIENGTDRQSNLVNRATPVPGAHEFSKSFAAAWPKHQEKVREYHALRKEAVHELADGSLIFNKEKLAELNKKFPQTKEAALARDDLLGFAAVNWDAEKGVWKGTPPESNLKTATTPFARSLVAKDSKSIVRYFHAAREAGGHDELTAVAIGEKNQGDQEIDLDQRFAKDDRAFEALRRESTPEGKLRILATEFLRSKKERSELDKILNRPEMPPQEKERLRELVDRAPYLPDGSRGYYGAKAETNVPGQGRVSMVNLSLAPKPEEQEKAEVFFPGLSGVKPRDVKSGGKIQFLPPGTKTGVTRKFTALGPASPMSKGQFAIPVIDEAGKTGWIQLTEGDANRSTEYRIPKLR